MKQVFEKNRSVKLKRSVKFAKLILSELEQLKPTLESSTTISFSYLNKVYELVNFKQICFLQLCLHSLSLLLERRS